MGCMRFPIATILSRLHFIKPNTTSPPPNYTTQLPLTKTKNRIFHCFGFGIDHFITFNGLILRVACMVDAIVPRVRWYASGQRTRLVPIRGTKKCFYVFGTIRSVSLFFRSETFCSALSLCRFFLSYLKPTFFCDCPSNTIFCNRNHSSTHTIRLFFGDPLSM